MNTIENLIKEYNDSFESRGMSLDALTLHNFVVTRKLKNILEFGVLHGSTTRALALAASKVVGSNYVSVDIENQCLVEAKEKLINDGTDKYVTFVCSDSIKYLSGQPANYWDLIFIDTDHHLKQTLTELFLAGITVKQNGGLIFLHDASMPEVMQAINIFEFYNKGKCSSTIFRTESGLVLITMEKK